MIPDGWKECTIREVAKVVRGASPRPAGSPLYFNGSYLPWITVSEVTGDSSMYIDSTKTSLTEEGAKFTRIIDPGTLILSNSGATLGVPKITRIRAGANDGIAMLLDLKEATKEFLYFFLQSQTLELREVIAPGNGQPNLNTELIGGIRLLLPPIKDQKLIAKVLGTWDKAISTTESLIAAKQQRKQAMMQQLLTGKMRLPGFSGLRGDTSSNFGRIPNDWRLLKIADFAEQISERNAADDALPVLSCTKHHGLVDSLSYFGKRVFSEDTSGYKVVPRNTFAYATNHIEEGSIGYQNLYDSALISPIYTVFRCEPKMIHDAYLLRVLKTETARHIFESMTSSSVDRRGSLRWNDFSTITLPIPSIAEQKRLDQFFSTVDRELTLLEAKKAALETQKKALMAVLLTGKKRLKV